MFSIGPFTFLDMTGVPDVVKMRLEAIERPGIDGTGFVELGRHGKPFTVQTAVDAADLAGAWDLFDQYSQLSEFDPQDLVFHDVAMSGYGLLFQVTDVRPVTICALAQSQGGLNPPGLGWCECDWDLLAVPAEV